MTRGQLTPLLSGAFPSKPAVHLQAALGCTSRQAKRMVNSGYVPAAFRAAVLALLDRSIEANLSRLSELRAQIREITHEEMVAEAARRRAGDLDTGADAAPRLAARAA